jgi:fatty acid desaturase
MILVMKLLSNVLGYMSVFGSLTVVMEIALNAIPHFRRIDLPLTTLAVIWLVAFLLAIAAALLGSRRWAFAALLPVLMFILALAVVYLNEPREKAGSWLGGAKVSGERCQVVRRDKPAGGKRSGRVARRRHLILFRPSGLARDGGSL